MLKSELIVLVISYAWIYCVIADNKDGIHLLLKNVNYHPYRKHVDKKYDVLDFSIYLPKTTKSPTTTVRNSRLTYSGHSPNTGTIEPPPIRNLKSSHQKNFRDTSKSNSAPYFESLPGVVPQKLKAPYNPPFYGPATVPPTATKLQNRNNQFIIKLPNHSSSIQRPSTVSASSSSHFLPTVPPLRISNTGSRTEIYFGNGGTSELSPHFERYTAPKPLIKQDPSNYVIRSPNLPHYEALTAPRPASEVIRNSKTPYYEAHTTYTGAGFQNQQLFNPQTQLQNRDELIHQSPIKGLLLNNIVYHDDNYKSSNAADGEDSEENDDSDDESYQVNEDPQESKKNYQKRPATQTVLPFLIRVQDSPKPEVSQQRNVENITPQPLIAEISLASPVSRNTSEDNVKDTKKRSRSNTKNATTKAVDEIKYFQYTNVLGPGSYTAGVRKGNPVHAVESHERALKDMGLYQKRVRWTDKNGGYGEHYWDLGHSKKS